MKGKIKSFFSERYIIQPDGATHGCSVFAMPDDLPNGTVGLRFEFDLIPDDCGMFRCVNLRADE